MAEWRDIFFFWAAFRLANRSQAKVGLLRGTLRSRAHARRVGTRPGVYPAKAGHPGRALFIRAVRVSKQISESARYPSSSRLLVSLRATAHVQHQQKLSAEVSMAGNTGDKESLRTTRCQRGFATGHQVFRQHTSGIEKSKS